MAARTVRLGEDSERILTGLVRDTGLSVSTLLEQGLLALRNQRMEGRIPNAYELYRELDLGPGGYALAPSTKTRRGVEQALTRQRR
jgi:hypothetical protein